MFWTCLCAVVLPTLCLVLILLIATFWTPHFQILNSTLLRLDSTFWLDTTLKLNFGEREEYVSWLLGRWTPILLSGLCFAVLCATKLCTGWVKNEATMFECPHRHSQCLKQFAPFLARYNAALFWTHLSILLDQTYNTKWRHLAIERQQLGFSLATSSEATAFDFQYPETTCANMHNFCHT